MSKRIIRILLVEDNPDDALLMVREIKKEENGWKFHIETVSNIKDIIHSLTYKSWDIILADYNLLTFNAMDVKAIVDGLGLNIPFILVSGSINEDVADKLIRQGVSDYINKNRLVKLHPVIRRELEVTSAYNETLRAWVNAIDIRDDETAGHSQRVTEYTVKLARALDRSEAEITHITRGALLHDVGKMGIPDSILLKASKLSDAEMNLMRTHAEIGYNLLKPIKFLKLSLDIPRYHHERWDGSGYPFGLEGKEIPIHARIFSVVDVYDALTSNRPYRSAWTREETLQYIQDNSGKLFDPTVVNGFVGIFNSLFESEVIEE